MGMGLLDQNVISSKAGMANRPTFQEIYDGWTKNGGTQTPEAPTILRVVSDFGSITPMWDAQYSLTNFSHYVIQVSEDQTDWYSLRFDGTWYGVIDEQTEVYGNSIPHTQVPHNDDSSIRTLYYRVASVTNVDVQSEWSTSVSGTTVWITQPDIQNSGEYVYTAVGQISISGEAVIVVDIPAYEEEYTGSGSITMSGATTNQLDLIATISGGVQTSGIATIEYEVAGFTITDYDTSAAIGYVYDMGTYGGSAWSAVLAGDEWGEDKWIQLYNNSTNTFGGKYALSGTDDIADIGPSIYVAGTTVWMAYEDDTNYLCEVNTGDYSPGFLTMNTPATFSADHTIDVSKNVVLSRQDTTNYPQIRYVNGGSITTVEPVFTINSATCNHGSITDLGSNKYLVTYSQLDLRARIVTWSGSSWSAGSESTIEADIEMQNYSHTVGMINSDKVAIFWEKDDNVNYIGLYNISGTTISGINMHTVSVSDMPQGNAIQQRQMIARETATDEGDILFANRKQNKVYHWTYTSNVISFDTSVDFLLIAGGKTNRCPIQWSDKTNGEFYISHESDYGSGCKTVIERGKL